MSGKEGYRGPESAFEKADVLDARHRFLQSFKEAALFHIAEKHERKPYHNKEHTETVAAHVRDILQIVRAYHPEAVAPQTETAAVAAAYAHDTVQKAVENPETKKLERQSGWEAGKNEFESYRTLEANIDHFIASERERCNAEDVDCRVDYLADLKSFFEAVKEKAASAIKGTVPAFAVVELDAAKLQEIGLPQGVIDSLRSPEFLGENLEATKVSQPNVTEDADIATLALALADLSQVGRISFSEAVHTGNGEFRELNYVVDEYGKRLQAGEELDPVEAELLYTEYPAWSHRQVGFMLWQWQRFNALLDNSAFLRSLEYGDEIRDTIKAKYAHFQENIEKQMVYAHELAKQYGPNTPADKEELLRFYTEKILQ